MDIYKKSRGCVRYRTGFRYKNSCGVARERNIEEPLMLLLWVDGARERPLSHSDFTWPLLSNWGAKVWLGRCVQRQWLHEALCSVWMAFRACFKMLELVGKGVVGGSNYSEFSWVKVLIFHDFAVVILQFSVASGGFECCQSKLQHGAMMCHDTLVS